MILNLSRSDNIDNNNNKIARARICPIECTLKILWDFEIKMNQLIPAKRSDLVPINKKEKKEKENYRYSGYCRLSGPQIKNQRKKKQRQLLVTSLGSKKVMEHEGDGDTNCSWCTCNSLQKLRKWGGTVGNQWTNWSHQNHGIAEIFQDTEKSPGNLRRLVVHQTSVKDRKC